MEISKNKMVTLTYDLRVEGSEGEVVEQATQENPLEFLYGVGMMLPKFESNLLGVTKGNSFEVMLEKADAYGEVNPDAFVELPKNVFEADGKIDTELIKVGNIVPMMSSNGQRLNGKVLELGEEVVKMDFNHPLAGEDLFFKGSVLEVREASEEEIAQILNGGGGGCGCGDNGCGPDDCGDGSCGPNDGSGGGCGC